jgi:DNA-directed RNA polymerase specialized sigma24 family protein
MGSIGAARLQRMIGRSLRCWVDAEDLEQESAVAWLESLAVPGSRRHDRAPDAQRFAWCVARNRLLDLAKRQRRERRAGSLEESEPEGLSVGQGDSSTLKCEDVPLMARAMGMLPTDQRWLLVFCEQFNLPWKTTAFIMDRPVNALQCLRTRALGSLRYSVQFSSGGAASQSSGKAYAAMAER